MYCISITFITLPKHLTSIDKSAFWSCTSLTSITVPAIFDLQLLLGIRLHNNDAGVAYADTVSRLIGKSEPMKFIISKPIFIKIILPFKAREKS